MRSGSALQRFLLLCSPRVATAKVQGPAATAAEAQGEAPRAATAAVQSPAATAAAPAEHRSPHNLSRMRRSRTRCQDRRLDTEGRFDLHCTCWCRAPSARSRWRGAPHKRAHRLAFGLARTGSSHPHSRHDMWMDGSVTEKLQRRTSLALSNAPRIRNRSSPEPRVVRYVTA